MTRELGLSPEAVAQFLHVSLRTVHNWFSGRHDIPYTAYRLLRLSLHHELPGAWSGWSIAAGQLWSPEGHGFKPEDSSWWSLLVRRAKSTDRLYQENQRLRSALSAARMDARASAERREAPLDLSLGHFGTRSGQIPAWPASFLDPRDCPAERRQGRPVRLAHVLKGGQA